MLKLETVFGAGAVVTPDFAAKLANQASKFSSRIRLEVDSTEFCVDSLIGILAMKVRKDTKIFVIADGDDEAAAAERISMLLREGE